MVKQYRVNYAIFKDGRTATRREEEVIIKTDSIYAWLYTKDSQEEHGIRVNHVEYLGEVEDD